MTIPEILKCQWLRENNEDLNESDRMINLSDKNLTKKSNPSHHIVENLNLSNLVPDGSNANEICYNDFIKISNEFHTQHIDEEALRVVERFGYDKEIVKKCIQKGELNHGTSCYELLMIDQNTV